MAKTVRLAAEIKDDLGNNDFKTTFSELGNVLNLKVTGDTRITGSNRDLKARIIEYRDQLPTDTDVPQQPQGEADAAPVATSKQRAPKPGSIGELIDGAHKSGFGRLRIKLIDAWYPELRGRAKKLERWHMPTDAQRVQFINTFDVLGAVTYQLEQDRLLLDKWEIPNAANMIGQELLDYEGVCGHQTQISRRMMIERLNNQNSKVPPFFRLCADCRAERTALLNMVPLAAQADSTCKTCGDRTFNTGANGLAKSRADLWENLLSGVMDVLNLPLRLRPEHLDSSGRHQTLVRNREQFEAWVEEYTINVSLAISAHPDMGAELKARMHQEIDAKRVELNLPVSSVSTETKKAKR